MYQVIHLHPSAPEKPAPGQRCNGCGVCCASEPCPAGILASGRRQGACAALLWNDEPGAYRCGLVEEPERHLPDTLKWAAPLLPRIARRFISAGSGCDASLSVMGAGALKH